MPYLSKLKIRLHSLRGDADIFASLSDPNPTNNNFDYRSRTGERIDEVVIQETTGRDPFTNSIYFSIYGNTFAQIKVEFEFEYKPSYNEQLTKALAIGDGSHRFEVIADEYEERLYSFAPWWSGKENRTVVFLADVLYNRVFFYTQWNAYPKHFRTSKHDINDTVAVYGGEPDHHNNGTYYTRLRPDFALYDLMSKRQYIYNMYAFSMAPSAFNEPQNGWETIALGEEYVGVTN